jgi:hypothetical protein
VLPKAKAGRRCRVAVSPIEVRPIIRLSGQIANRVVIERDAFAGGIANAVVCSQPIQPVRYMAMSPTHAGKLRATIELLNHISSQPSEFYGSLTPFFECRLTRTSLDHVVQFGKD